MVSISTIVQFVFVAIVVVVILSVLWWAIGYAEGKFPAPMAWNLVRVLFVLMCVFVIIAALMSLIGHPIVGLQRD